MAKRFPVALPILLAASTSFALPRPNSHVRAGANHHLGDESFVVKYGHNVDIHASERDRMHQHLQYVRDWLASRPATRPELEQRRAEILAHFDAYIAKNTTPKNVHVPWRTPVFVDDEGTICAVGYLIEQTTNRELPQRIAKAHRYDFIEDIATAMPEVADWVASSGFTLDEIAHIQPAYSEPEVKTWRTWDLAKYKPADGLYDKLSSRGAFKHGKMEGRWVAYSKPDNPSAEEIIVGRGDMKHGDGAWTSLYDDGKTFAQGPYVDNVAEGAWKLYHPSGNLAAEGSFANGNRDGLWRFYYDTPDKTPIAIGRFAPNGEVTGKWKHFDAHGELLARSWTETPDQWQDTDWEVDGGEGFMLDITARPGGIKHASHRGTVNSETQALDMYALGGERVYVHSAYQRETMYDADGDKLVHGDDGTWRAASCRWNAKRKAYAHHGDLVPLHGALYTDARRRAKPEHEGVGGSGAEDPGPACGREVAVAPARAAKLDALLVARDQVRALTPQFVRSAVLHEELPEEDLSDSDRENLKRASDMARFLEENMGTYLEWPHIDGRFVELFKRMAGRKFTPWAGGDPEAANEAASE
jgi:MORN repeat variant